MPVNVKRGEVTGLTRVTPFREELLQGSLAMHVHRWSAKSLS